MLLASRAAWPGIVLILLTTGISGPRAPPLTPGPGLGEEVAAVTSRNDVKIIQETLRDNGHYRGKVDGVFGLRTQAAIRGFQKAENLPVTGQIDTQTAGKLGVRPQRREETVEDTSMGKPSAGIKWPESSLRATKTQWKAVKTAAASKSAERERENALQADKDVSAKGVEGDPSNEVNVGMPPR
jgi:peptidoglycan hydrolase-like protein with peptidoglycan-binding domain